MSENGGSSKPPGDELTAEAIFDDIEVLEPYTTGELASRFDVAKRRLQALLEGLSAAGKIRKKEPEPNHPIWIRDAPIHECPACGYRYEVKFLHPVLSSVRYCPRCGNQL